MFQGKIKTCEKKLRYREKKLKQYKDNDCVQKKREIKNKFSNNVDYLSAVRATIKSIKLHQSKKEEIR